MSTILRSPTPSPVILVLGCLALTGGTRGELAAAPALPQSTEDGAAIGRIIAAELDPRSPDPTGVFALMSPPCDSIGAGCDPDPESPDRSPADALVMAFAAARQLQVAPEPVADPRCPSRDPALPGGGANAVFGSVHLDTDSAVVMMTIRCEGGSTDRPRTFLQQYEYLLDHSESGEWALRSRRLVRIS